jgi:hypothetical protein
MKKHQLTDWEKICRLRKLEHAIAVAAHKNCDRLDGEAIDRLCAKSLKIGLEIYRIIERNREIRAGKGISLIELINRK